MSTKREERERLRQERLAAQQAASSAERRRLLIGYVVAGLIVAAIIAGVVVAISGSGGEGKVEVGGEEVDSTVLERAGIQEETGSLNDFQPDGREGTPPPALAQGDLELAAKEAGCELKLDLPDEGNKHFGPKEQDFSYGTNPATSGDHIVPGLQQADGAYTEQPNEEYVVHSLEHGRVAIQYSPDLSEEEQLELKGIFDESPGGLLLFPNADMPYEVAATAWTQLVGCETYEGAATLDVIRDFRDIYRGRGPEPVPLTF